MTFSVMDVRASFVQRTCHEMRRTRARTSSENPMNLYAVSSSERQESIEQVNRLTARIRSNQESRVSKAENTGEEQSGSALTEAAKNLAVFSQCKSVQV